MIYDVWIRVIYFLRIKDLFIFRQTNRFLHQCIENELIKNFPWYHFKEQLKASTTCLSLSEITSNAPNASNTSSSQFIHFINGFAIQVVSIDKEGLFILMSDYVGNKKYIRLHSSSCYSFCEIFRVSPNFICLKFEQNQIDYIIDIDSLSVTRSVFNHYQMNKLFDNEFYIEPKNTMNLLEGHQFIFKFADFSVSVFMGIFLSGTFIMKMLNCPFIKESCVCLCVLAKNHWLFYNNWQHHRFFHLQFDTEKDDFRCDLIYVSDNCSLKNYGAFYSKELKTISIVDYTILSNWKIIKELYCDVD